MNTLIGKELRENAKWALIILVLLALVIAYDLGNTYQFGYGLVDERMQNVTMFWFAGAGAVIGLLQILQDSRRGRRSFLIHRPISRGQMFIAKVIVGISFYFLCTAIPLALAIVWAATPGHIAAPFEWHMILPRLADLIGGLTWYFAALLLASRSARWIGSRLAPVGLVLIASVYAEERATNLAESILISAAAILILFPAAWSAFTHDGEYESQPLVFRILQTISVAMGVAFAMGLAIAFAEGISQSIFAAPPTAASTQYQIQNDGQIFRVTTGPGDAFTVTDLAGNPMPSISRKQIWNNGLGEAYLSLEDRGPNTPNKGTRLQYWRLQSQFAYVRTVGHGTGNDTWYYDVGNNVIEGYDLNTRHFAGSIGPNGYVPPSEPPQPFPQKFLPGSRNERFAVPTTTLAAYQLDLQSREIDKIFSASSQDPILDAQPFPNAANPQDNSYVAVATHSFVHFLKDGNELFTLPLEHGYPPYITVSIGRTTLGHFIVDYFPDYDIRASEWVTETDESGRILRHVELPPLPISPPDPPNLADYAGMAAAPPGVQIPFCVIRPAGFPPTGGFLIESILVAIASAAVTIKLMGRYDSSKSAYITWTIFNIITGIGGVLLLLCMRSTVAKRRCPHCARLRHVTHEQCEHCGKPFESPKLEGIEVFEMAAV